MLHLLWHSILDFTLTFEIAIRLQYSFSATIVADDCTCAMPLNMSENIEKALFCKGQYVGCFFRSINDYITTIVSHQKWGDVRAVIGFV